MKQSKGYVDSDYLQMTAALVNLAKERSYAQMHVSAGDRVLDVGCGAGTDTVALAGLVGPAGRVVGIDIDGEMVGQAEGRAHESGVEARVEHRQGDAAALPFEAGEFQASRSERLFQHLVHPEQALAEMVRVTRPGGRIVVLESDYGSLSFDTDETDIERRLCRFIAEKEVQSGYAGRRLLRLFRQQALTGVEIEVLPVPLLSYPLCRQAMLLDRFEREAQEAGVLAPEEIARWRSSLEQAEREGAFFACANLVLASAGTRA
jgi:ubiquinone/menaquinone biosynthesis C-methylase UbiE